MPSPVGHLLAGLAVARLFRNALGPRAPLAMGFAVAPDLDLMPRVADDDARVEHGQATHTVAAALAAGAAAGLVARRTGGRFGPAFTAAAAAYGSHLLLDLLCKQPEDGLPLFWPASDRTYGTRRPLFATLRSRGDDGFVVGLFNGHNLRAVVREVLLVAPLVVLAEWIHRR